MLDFSKVRNKEITYAELAANLSKDDLRNLANEMTDKILGIIADATDADVVFQPSDPDAYDSAAATADEEGIAWTLGHVVVHVTASNEEEAFLAAELARGVEPHGRSRYETHWTTVTTIAQVRERLEESRRMCLATLDVWPNDPHMDVVRKSSWAGDVNANTSFILGLSHANSHLGQLADIMKQAKGS